MVGIEWVKLPKQWRHWCKLAGLEPEKRRLSGSWFYLVGRGRLWRVNIYGEFQASEVYDAFDRWSNSVEKTFPMPKTRDEFLEVVKGYRRTVG